MKTKFLLPLFGLTLFVSVGFGFNPIITFNEKLNVTQDTIEIDAVFDGHEDYGYNFIAKRENDEEYTITFQEVKEEVLKTFDLKSETFIKKKFKITYTTEILVTIDADGYEDEQEVNTIIKLEKV